VRQLPETNRVGDGTVEQLRRAFRDARHATGRIAEPRQGFLEWCEAVPTARGAALDFVRYPWQPEVYKIFSDLGIEEACIMKSTQVGASELCVRLALYLADVCGATGLYVFPALKQMHEFSSSRIDPLVDQSEYLRSRTQLDPRWPWSKGLRRIGTLDRSGFVHFRGSESKRDLISVDADFVVMDEYDMLAQQNVPEAERRVGASSLGIKRRLGVPSDAEFGIAKRYGGSKASQWFVTCQHCGQRQAITFYRSDARDTAFVAWDEPDGVVSDPRVVCGRCEKAIDVLIGEWVAEYPGRSEPGFHVHRLLLADERNRRQLIGNSKKRTALERQSFWNNDLGLPFVDAEGGLDRGVLHAAIAATERVIGRPQSLASTSRVYPKGGYFTMGVDVASSRNLNVRISFAGAAPGSDPRLALYIGEVSEFEALPDLMERYAVDVCVIDSQPETRSAMKFASLFPGRVFLCTLSPHQEQPMVVRRAEGRVTVNRTWAMDTTVDLLRSLANLLPEDLPKGYIEQMLAPRREVRPNQFGRPSAAWVSHAPDDYFMAETFDVVAAGMLQQRLAELYPQYELVSWEQVIGPFRPAWMDDWP